MNTEQPKYLITGDLNVTLILEGQTHSIGQSHPNHQAILDAIRDKTWDVLPTLVDIPQAMSTYTDGNVTVNQYGEVSFDGEPVHGTVATRITQFFNQGLPFQPLVRFLERLMSNPSRRSVEELYGFLENEGMALMEDGRFVGYKGISGDFTDRYTGTVDNSPGKVISMPRNQVDDDARQSCSYGYHVGSQSYASSWATSGGRVVLVAVDPADCVSVPYASAQKLRVCKYEVLREVDHATILQSPLYDETEVEEEEETCYVFDEDDYDDDTDPAAGAGGFIIRL